MKNTDDIITISESFIINLNSMNASKFNNGSYNSSVRFDFEQTIEREKECILMYCNVLSFTCPNSIYTIHENNSLLSITLNNITTDYIIMYGFYDSNSFMIQLIKQIGISFNITLDLITNKFTLNNSLYNFQINSNSTIFDIMGFEKNININSINKSLIMPFMCNFNGIQNINIQVENFNTNNLDSINKTNSSVLQAISIDNTCQQIIFNKTVSNKFILSDTFISFMTINIVDDLLRPINLNNKHFNLVIEFTELTNVNRFHYKTNFQTILDYGYTNY